MKPVIIHSEAREELDSAIAYYEEQKAGLGLDFLSEVEEALSKIQQNPNLGELYKFLDYAATSFNVFLSSFSTQNLRSSSGLLQ